MGNPVALVTGAGGEMGHLLLPALRSRGFDTVALDLVDLPRELASGCVASVRASVLDGDAMRSVVRRHHPSAVFHLAAVLSTKAEREPELAYDVNVGGTVSLFRLCREDAREMGRPVRFLFPSSMAVYGLPDRDTKDAAGAVRETEWDRPTALYGINKLQCEMLGSYLTARDARESVPGIDFRAVRFPGLISAETLPSGGTSDFAPEMMHAAAQGKAYACFVSEDTRLPFMTMSDAVEGFLRLLDAPAASLSARVYNIKGFSATASEIRESVLELWPDAGITFQPNPLRQAIADSWPGDMNDSLARRDWGFSPRFDLRNALRKEFLPALQRRYPARTAP